MNKKEAEAMDKKALLNATKEWHKAYIYFWNLREAYFKKYKRLPSEAL